ncbi:TPA: hypothetical protein IF279_001480 [Escherichia coli]|nr:hypothetical protein [Escherichia coli]
MKTVSQNTPTIYSATTPENNPPQLVASLVPDEQRISFWPQHFGLIPQWVTLEPRVFGWMDRLCEDYCGGIWNLYTLNNGGAFMALGLVDIRVPDHLIVGGNQVFSFAEHGLL